MGWMDWLDPGGIGRSVLNPGGIANPVMPYLSSIGTGVGGVIGGVYGGPAGAAAGGFVGGMGGEQLGRYLATDEYERDPYSGEVLESAAKKGAIGGALSGAGWYLAGPSTGAGTGAGETGAGYSLEAGSVASGPEWGMTGTTAGTTTGAGATAANTGKSSSILSNLGSNKALLGTMALGGALDYYGNVQQAQAMKEGQEAYREATSWTPERTSAYMTALQNIVGGVYSTEEEKKKKSVAAMLASAGRGGGAYGGAAEKLGRERRESAAKLLAAGALETSKPPNYPLGAFTTTSPEGQAMINIGGTAGKYLTTAQQMAMLQALYGNRGATA